MTRQARPVHRPNRVHSVLVRQGRCYGLAVPFPLLSTMRRHIAVKVPYPAAVSQTTGDRTSTVLDAHHLRRTMPLLRSLGGTTIALWSTVLWFVMLVLTDSVFAGSRNPTQNASHAATSSVSFRNDVMAVFSKAGCSAGTCHGNKNGKGGF